MEISYTIMVYNKKTQKYTEIVPSFLGKSREDAEQRFKRERNWKPISSDEVLFVKGPVCR